MRWPISAAAYQADHAKGIKPQRPAGQEAQQVLSWLILFRIYDKISQQQRHLRHAGRDHQAAGSPERTGQPGEGDAPGLRIRCRGGAAGPSCRSSPSTSPSCRALETRFNGGKPPTSASATLQDQVAHTQCVAAKSLGVQVNPQFGVFDYHTYSVVLAAPKLAADPVPSPTVSKALINPPC